MDLCRNNMLRDIDKKLVTIGYFQQEPPAFRVLYKRTVKQDECWSL